MPAAADVDFLMGALEDTGESRGAATPSGKPTPEKPTEDEIKQAETANQEAMDAIVDVMMPKEEVPEAVKPEGEQKKKSEEKEEVEPESAVQPKIHDASLLRLAGSWGIGPDEAARYPTEEALLGAVALREIRWRRAAESRETQKPAEASKDADEFDIPEIKLDEDADPAVKAVVTTLLDTTKKLKAWADKKIAAQALEINSLKTEHEQAALERSRNQEAKIAQLFDEKVKTWGESYQELLGVPTKTWTKPGTKEHAELQKLYKYARERAAGYETLSGSDATVEDIAGFLEEGRYALWPDRVKTAVRNEISNGVKKQRGGVALRPGKARDSEPPEQGDEPAKAAIGDLMTEFGLNPWARRKAS